MNTFRRNDKVKVYGQTKTVSYTDGPFVHFVGGNGNYASYQECTLVAPEPKFKPGDVVRNGSSSDEHTIKCVKTRYGYDESSNDSYTGPVAYDYAGYGWDLESSLTLIRSAVPIPDLIKAGKRIEAINMHRIINGSGLKEAKDAIEALESEMDSGTTIEEAFAAAVKPKFKVGDRVNHEYGEAITYVVKDVRPSDGYLFFDGYSFVGYINPKYFSLAGPSSLSIVILKRGERLSPATSPLVHATRELAELEARRLAVKHPGSDFVVFTLASTSSAPKPVTPVAVTVSA
jgi:hypothetical protein